MADGRMTAGGRRDGPPAKQMVASDTGNGRDNARSVSLDHRTDFILIEHQNILFLSLVTEYTSYLIALISLKRPSTLRIH